MLAISHEGPDDGPLIEALLDRAFGSDRLNKTSYRYRDGIPPLAGLSLVARERGVLVGSIRYWPIRLGVQPALLLGPLAIDPVRQGQGIGRALTRASLDLAEAAGWRLVFLVGDPGYYARYGFAVVPDNVVMPDEGGVLLRAGGEPADQGAAQLRHPLVAGHARLHLADPCDHGTGDGGVGGDLVQAPEQGADSEHDGAGPRQAAQGLALDAQPQLLPGVLGREVGQGHAWLRVE
jgi:predicted N-acetyltransferase YhbS